MRRAIIELILLVAAALLVGTVGVSSGPRSLEGAPHGGGIRAAAEDGGDGAGRGGTNRHDRVLQDKRDIKRIERTPCENNSSCGFYTGYCGEGACDVCMDRRFLQDGRGRGQNGRGRGQNGRVGGGGKWASEVSDGDGDGPHRCREGEGLVLCDVHPCTKLTSECHDGYCRVVDPASTAVEVVEVSTVEVATTETTVHMMTTETTGAAMSTEAVETTAEAVVSTEATEAVTTETVTTEAVTTMEAAATTNEASASTEAAESTSPMMTTQGTEEPMTTESVATPAALAPTGPGPDLVGPVNSVPHPEFGHLRSISCNCSVGDVAGVADDAYVVIDGIIDDEGGHCPGECTIVAMSAVGLSVSAPAPPRPQCIVDDDCRTFHNSCECTCSALGADDPDPELCPADGFCACLSGCFGECGGKKAVCSDQGTCELDDIDPTPCLGDEDCRKLTGWCSCSCHPYHKDDPAPTWLGRRLLSCIQCIPDECDKYSAVCNDETNLCDLGPYVPPPNICTTSDDCDAYFITEHDMIDPWPVCSCQALPKDYPDVGCQSEPCAMAMCMDGNSCEGKMADCIDGSCQLADIPPTTCTDDTECREFFQGCDCSCHALHQTDPNPVWTKNYCAMCMGNSCSTTTAFCNSATNVCELGPHVPPPNVCEMDDDCEAYTITMKDKIDPWEPCSCVALPKDYPDIGCNTHECELNECFPEDSCEGMMAVCNSSDEQNKFCELASI